MTAIPAASTSSARVGRPARWTTPRPHRWGRIWRRSFSGFPREAVSTSTPPAPTRPAIIPCFLQDDFRARPNMTLNLGIRYERDLPTTERYDRSVNGFDFSTPSPISARASAAYDRSPIPQIPAGQFRTPGGSAVCGAGKPGDLPDSTAAISVPGSGLPGPRQRWPAAP